MVAAFHKIEAEVLGVAVSLELLAPRDIVRWADAIVAEEHAPDPGILAIAVDSLGERFDELDAIEALSRVGGSATASEVTNAFLGMLAARLAANPGLAWEVSGALFRLATGAEP